MDRRRSSPAEKFSKDILPKHTSNNNYNYDPLINCITFIICLPVIVPFMFCGYGIGAGIPVAAGVSAVRGVQSLLRLRASTKMTINVGFACGFAGLVSFGLSGLSG